MISISEGENDEHHSLKMFYQDEIDIFAQKIYDLDVDVEQFQMDSDDSDEHDHYDHNHYDHNHYDHNHDNYHGQHKIILDTLKYSKNWEIKKDNFQFADLQIGIISSSDIIHITISLKHQDMKQIYCLLDSLFTFKLIKFEIHFTDGFPTKNTEEMSDLIDSITKITNIMSFSIGTHKWSVEF